MGTRTLTRCTGCERHVYVDDPTCPFCGDASPRVTSAPRVAGGLSRAAGHAARAVLIAGAVACAKSSDPDSGTPGATAMETDASGQDSAMQPPLADSSVAQLDAAADDAQTTPVPDASQPDSTVPVDAGGFPLDATADADSATDAGEWEDVTPIPLYGGVFPDPRKRAVV